MKFKYSETTRAVLSVRAAHVFCTGPLLNRFAHVDHVKDMSRKIVLQQGTNPD